MATFEIRWRSSAERDLRSIRKDMISRIKLAIEELAEVPHPVGSVKLAGSDHTYRIRIGDYRVLYEVHDAQVFIIVVAVGHRKDIYR